MPDGEKFSIVKWFSGFVNPITWSKSVAYLAMIVIILFVAFTVYRAYFMKNQQQKTHITVQKGGTANITNVQNQNNKRPWWMPIPYISIFGEAKGSPRSSFDDVQYGYGAQAGIRWDF